jgi:hypothetical protein
VLPLAWRALNLGKPWCPSYTISSRTHRRTPSSPSVKPSPWLLSLKPHDSWRPPWGNARRRPSKVPTGIPIDSQREGHLRPCLEVRHLRLCQRQSSLLQGWLQRQRLLSRRWQPPLLHRQALPGGGDRCPRPSATRVMAPEKTVAFS